MDRISDVAMAIVAVAMVTTIVSHRNTAKVITAAGRSFSQALKAATGQ